MADSLGEQKGIHLVSEVRNRKAAGKCLLGRVRIGGSDPSVTGNAGMVAVTELGQRRGCQLICVRPDGP